MQKRLTRKEVPLELTWNLGDLFPSVEVWEAALGEVEADLPAIAQFKGRLGEGAGTFRACFERTEALLERFIRVATYAGLQAAGDGADPINQANYGRIASLEAVVDTTMAFIRSETLLLPEGTIERYIAAEPALEAVRFYLEKLLETRPHMLSPETEEALAALGEVHGSPYMIYERCKSSDIAFPPFCDKDGSELENSFALYEDDFETSPDVERRHGSYRSFTEGLKRYQHTLAATFATEVKKNVVTAKLRKYPSAAHMLVKPHLVPLAAQENLLEIIQTELAPHMRRYARLRKRVLGLDQLLYCDLEAPLDPAYSPKVSFSEASDLILESLAPMGEEYLQIMRLALGERWCDLADNVGKSTGAFCSSPYGAHPYILITWTDSMRSAFVMAHELGHAGHFALANRYQRLVNTEVSTYFVEAPSTINELLLGQHILARSTDSQMRRWVLMQFLATYHHNFVRHLLEGELQRQIYALAEKGRPITASTLNETKGAILERFWGDTVAIDEGARLTWMRQPHYYMGLYPYTYSAGLTAATAVAQLMQEEGAPAYQRWLEVLKAGGTKRPLELMAIAGVDMSKQEPIRKAVAYVGSLIDELERSF